MKQQSRAQTTMDSVAVEHHQTIIIGAGFSGLGMAIRLKQSGDSDFLLLEKESGVGGTWRVNHYPGCACDVQSHLYSFSFAPNPDWSRMYAPQPEIRDYLQGCADRFKLWPHIRLATTLKRAWWDDGSQLWQLEDASGRRYSARILVSGMGALSMPAYPRIPGIDRFQGKAFHSQQWDHDYDLRGKHVAVIGTGASAIQFVPKIQRQVAHLDLYQRTPPWIIPKPDRPMKGAERKLFSLVPATQKALRAAIYASLEARVMGLALHPGLMAIARRWALKHIDSQISNPDLRQKLTPDYEIGCKRILLSNDYYPALDQPNVNVITDDVQEVTGKGVVTSDGTERKVDAIIYGTGFKATDPVPAGLIFGRNGEDLHEAWREGPEAYKGTTVTGFPNLFVLMGPNTGLGHSSMVYMIESQIQYVLDAMKLMRKRHLAAVEVKPQLQQSFNQRIQNKLGGSVWNSGGCNSWYLHPVSGKNVSLWPGFTFQFRLMTRRFDAGAYRLKRLGASGHQRDERSDAPNVVGPLNV